MRHRFFLIPLAIAVTGLGVLAADVLTQVGVTPADAKQMVIDSVSGGYVPVSYFSKVFKAASPATRAQLVQGGIAWAKTYVASPEFAAAYQKMRASRKPEEPHFEGTPEDEFKRKQEKDAADQAKNAEDMKQVLAQMPPDQRKQMEETMKQVAEIQKQANTPEMKAMMLQGIVNDRASKVKEYQDDLKKWGTDFPEQPAALVAKRLHQFLDLSATVDFDAKLVSNNGGTRFANPAYESKPEDWKICFRAGKDATMAARAAAEAWLKELAK